MKTGGNVVRSCAGAGLVPAQTHRGDVQQASELVGSQYAMQRRPLRRGHGRCIERLVDVLEHCAETIRFQLGPARVSKEQPLSDAGLRDVSGHAFPFLQIQTIDRSWGKETHSVRSHDDRDPEPGDFRVVERTVNGLYSDICHVSDSTQQSRHREGSATSATDPTVHSARVVRRQDQRQRRCTQESPRDRIDPAGFDETERRAIRARSGPDRRAARRCRTSRRTAASRPGTSRHGRWRGTRRRSPGSPRRAPRCRG